MQLKTASTACLISATVAISVTSISGKKKLKIKKILKDQFKSLLRQYTRAFPLIIQIPTFYSAGKLHKKTHRKKAITEARAVQFEHGEP